MIICAGESLIDMVSFATENGEVQYTPHVGGSILNSAIALGRLGADAYYCGAISNDTFGGLIEDCLKDSKVQQDFVINTNRPTTLAYADIDDQGIAKYTFVDEHSAGRLIDEDSLKPFVNKIKNAKALLVGGISLQVEPCGSSWQWLVEQVAGGCVIYFDANIRPDFIEDKDKYLERFEQFTRKVDVIKISEEDYSYLYGEQDYAKVSSVWLESGVKLILLTLGDKGVKAVYSDGKEISVGIEPVKVIDTIAAGDSFNAGLLFDLYKQKMLDQEKLVSIDTSTLKKALTFANQVAGFTVTQKGANPPWLHQIK
ncbi:MAG TPA: carbohydrate kinase [Candidatus Thioglobus sp.]|jgi:fructokinase|nr:carbohydrate kinase [Candidatus Thioglobus sp.]HIK77764.1 carbohydrate kinase [Gammaproteobacteria bacterium]